VLIGTEGSMATRLSEDECRQRLQDEMRSFLLGSRVDMSGFRLAKAGRTAVRIRGTFTPRAGGGTLVAYRVELLPAALIGLAIAYPLGLLVIGGMLWLRFLNLIDVWPLVPITVVVGGLNLWFSDRQARRLVDFVCNQLEAS
jgi:hypothetical protein